MAKKTEKPDVKKLTKELLIPRTSGCYQTEEKTFKKADEYCEGYKAFMDASKTERESVETAVAMAKKKGFEPYDPAKKYAAGDKYM